MKKLAVAIFCLVNFICTKAQKNFEGYIKYEIITTPSQSGLTTQATYITAYFKNNLIKTVITEFRSYDSTFASTEKLIDFNNGMGYTTDSSTKVIIKDSLKAGKEIKKFTAVLKNDSSKFIRNYECYAYSVSPNIEDSAVKDAHFWYSKKLLFQIPDKFKSLDAVILFSDGQNIGLGAMAGLDIGDTIVTININPTEIVETAIPDSLFSLPPTYKSYFRDDYNKILLENFKTVDDSFIKKIDNDSFEKVEKKPVKKQATQKGGHKPPPPKKTSTVKSPAIIRKP